MGWRDAMHELVDALFDYGRVRGSVQTANAKTVTIDVEGAVGASSERRAGQGFWGHAAVMARPKAPTTSPEGSCEVIYLRRGEEMVSIASRDLRWQVDLSEGDVVIRNLDGTNPVRLHLLADGTAVLEANTVKIGDASATEKIGLGTAIKSHFDSLKTYVDNHVHVAGTLVAGMTAVTGATGAPSSSSPSVPDVESRHVVEN